MSYHDSSLIHQQNKSDHSSPASVVSLGLGSYTDQVLDDKPRSRAASDRYDASTTKTASNPYFSNMGHQPENPLNQSKKSNSSSSNNSSARTQTQPTHDQSHSSSHGSQKTRSRSNSRKDRRHSLRNRTSSITSQPVCPIELQKTLDPQIQEELENLNICSNRINEIENKLETSRSEHRAVLSKSAQLLGQCSKKLGTSVEKARPYYIAKFKAKSAQKLAQDATNRYQRAVSNHEDSKEMVSVAEQSMRHNATDPAWHQYLNHVTNRVNEAEIERHIIEQEVQQTTKLAIDTQAAMSRLNKEHKHSINHSREYFELKNKLSEKLDQLQKKVKKIEDELNEAKAAYKSALRSLENISERIHFARDQQRKRLRPNSLAANGGGPSPSPEKSLPSHETASEGCGLNTPRKNSDVSLSALSDSHESCNSSSTHDCAPYHNAGTVKHRNHSAPDSVAPMTLNLLPHDFHQKLPIQPIPEDQLEESQSVVEIALAKHRERFGQQTSSALISPVRTYSKDDMLMNYDVVIREDLKRRDSLEKVDGVGSTSSFEGSLEGGISRLGLGVDFNLDNFLMKDQKFEGDLQSMRYEQNVGSYQGHTGSQNNMSMSSGISSRAPSSANVSEYSRQGSQSLGSKVNNFIFQSLNVKDLGK